MLRDSVQPPVQRGFKSSDDILFPPFSDIAEENLRPFCRVLCTILLIMGSMTTPTTYNSSESKCKDLGQFYHANEAGHMCWTVWLQWRLEAGFV